MYMLTECDGLLAFTINLTTRPRNVEQWKQCQKFRTAFFLGCGRTSLTLSQRRASDSHKRKFSRLHQPRWILQKIRTPTRPWRIVLNPDPAWSGLGPKVCLKLHGRTWFKGNILSPSVCEILIFSKFSVLNAAVTALVAYLFLLLCLTLWQDVEWERARQLHSQYYSWSLHVE